LGPTTTAVWIPLITGLGVFLRGLKTTEEGMEMNWFE